MKDKRSNLRWLLWRSLAVFPALLGLASPLLAYPQIAAKSQNAPSAPPPHILVKFRGGLSAGKKALSATRYSIAREIPELGVHVIPIPVGRTAEDFIADFKMRYGADLVYAEADHVRYAVKTPNDPFFAFQYHLSKISCPAAWDSTTGSGIIIAIADTGILTTHADLAAHLISGFNVVDNDTNVSDLLGHGTMVAGAAAAVGDNLTGVAGVAYNATILPLRISTDPQGITLDSYIASAITYAADHGAKVINISFNADAPGACWPQTVLDAANYMRSKQGLVVMAAGNAGIDKGCPNNPEIINVAATDQNDGLASFSNFGAELDVSAPGVGILTTNCTGCSLAPGEDYASVSGTSFAAPITAGVIALIYSIDPAFTADQVQQILIDSAVDLGAGGYDTNFGWGRVNAQGAIGVAHQRSILFQRESLSNVYAYPNPWDTRKYSNRQVTLANVPDDATIKIFAISGFWVKNLTASNGRAVWDLTNDKGERVASGLYFYNVKTPSAHTTGEIAIIK